MRFPEDQKSLRANHRTRWTCGSAVAALALIGSMSYAPNLAAQVSTSTNAPITGAITSLTLTNPDDKYSAGRIVVGGQTIILPRNLLLDQPANRMTLKELFDQAPGDCQGIGSGLAANDVCQGPRATRVVGVATIKANRVADGRVIAGEVMIERGQESLSGVVTEINHTDGYLMVGATMVRINDPSMRHTIQSGAGCAADSTTNCSPDARFGLDPDNYTISFSTGFPACIASTQGAVAGVVDRATGGDAEGNGDAYCPQTNRNGLVVAAVGDGDNTKRFAPINVGDHITAEGSYENVGGQRFFSAHTLGVHVALTTQVGQPNYITFDEAEWDTAGFQNQRIRGLFIGFGTSSDDVELYSVNVLRATGNTVEYILGSTQGCDQNEGAGTCTAQGLNADQIFRIRYDIDFIQIAQDGAIDTRRRQPCLHLVGRDAFPYPSQATAAGAARMNPCTSAADTLGAVKTMVPITREITGRTRARAQAYADNTPSPVRDIKGAEATWGEYLTPIGLVHPEFVEIDLNRIQTPYIFEGQSWNLDRRSGPGGCNEDGVNASGVPNCGNSDLITGSLRLAPFPASCLVPGGQVPNPPLPVAEFTDLITSVRLANGTMAVLPSDVPAITSLCPSGLAP